MISLRSSTSPIQRHSIQPIILASCSYLTLNLSGTIIEAVSAAVPEPNMFALVSIGLLGFLGIRRTERRDEETNVASLDNTSLTSFGETELDHSTYQVSRLERSMTQRNDWDAQ